MILRWSRSFAHFEFGRLLVLMKYKVGISCFLLTSLLLSAGCQNVKPWQRGTLADVSMRSDRDPLGSALDNHIFFSREAAEGGQSVGGGGCGCN